MSFYEYRQNNSGGNFMIDDKVSRWVFIEANSPAEADYKAEQIGIYFDGVENDIDCPCCGNRWHRADAGDAIELPINWSHKMLNTIEEYIQKLVSEYARFYNDNAARIYYADGRVNTF